MEMVIYLQHGRNPEASCMSIDSNCGGKRLCTSFVPQPDMINNVNQICYWNKHHVKIIWSPFHYKCCCFSLFSMLKQGYVLWVCAFLLLLYMPWSFWTLSPNQEVLYIVENHVSGKTSKAKDMLATRISASASECWQIWV